MERVVSTIERGTTIGRKSAGLACIPNGGLRWGEDIAVVGDEQRLALVAADELALSDLPVRIAERPDVIFDPAMNGPPSAHHVGAEIISAQFAVCRTQWAFGSRAVKGSGKLEMRWHVFSSEAGRTVRSVTVQCSAKPEARQANFAALFEQVLRSCARQFAADAETRALLRGADGLSQAGQ